MTKIEEMRDNAFDSYVAKLTQINFLPEPYAVALGCCAMWKRWTGQIVRPYVLPGFISLTFHMETELKEGGFPDKEKHIGQILAHIQACGGWFLKDDGEYERTFDSYSDDFSFTGKGHFPSIKVYAYHGGNCQMVQVGTKTVEKPIYEVKCL